MKKFGIDISHWQGQFDFHKAKSEGVEFVIIKAGGSDAGVYVDSMFERNYSQALANDLPVGAYWYSKAMSVAEAERDARYLIQYCLYGRRFALPIYIDVEDAALLGLPTDKTTEIVSAFCDYLEKRGYFVGVYSSTWMFENELDEEKLKRYTHWCAHWSTQCTFSGAYDMWQFGGDTNRIRSNKIAGVTTDQNYLYKDFPTIIKNAGLNGFTKPVENELVNDASDYAKDAVEWAIEHKLIIGDENGDLMIHEPITTERFLTILHRYHLYRMQLD